MAPIAACYSLANVGGSGTVSGKGSQGELGTLIKSGVWILIQITANTHENHPCAIGLGLIWRDEYLTKTILLGDGGRGLALLCA
jgi:hypothetical protein